MGAPSDRLHAGLLRLGVVYLPAYQAVIVRSFPWQGGQFHVCIHFVPAVAGTIAAGYHYSAVPMPTSP